MFADQAQDGFLALGSGSKDRLFELSLLDLDEHLLDRPGQRRIRAMAKLVASTVPFRVVATRAERIAINPRTETHFQRND